MSDAVVAWIALSLSVASAAINVASLGWWLIATRNRRRDLATYRAWRALVVAAHDEQVATADGAPRKCA